MVPGIMANKIVRVCVGYYDLNQVFATQVLSEYLNSGGTPPPPGFNLAIHPAKPQQAAEKSWANPSSLPRKVDKKSSGAAANDPSHC